MSCNKGEDFISEETRPIWNGDYSTQKLSSFREKVDKVVRESASQQNSTTEPHLIKDERCNLTRIKKVWGANSTLKLVEEWKSMLSQQIPSLLKSGEMSNKLRQEGNEYYKRKLFRMAQKGFTLSLCFAPIDSKEQILAYSNRSASFMEMGEKENCLFDIDRALEVMEGSAFSQLGCSELQPVRTKLLERKSRCVNIQEKVGRDENGNENQQHQYFSMQNPSKFIEAAEDFVEIQDKPGRGRHVTVTKNVDPGTVLILEEPYSKVLVKQFRWETKFCHFCFKCITNSPSVPCSGCVFAVYCSYNCQLLDSAQHDFYECKITGFLHQLELKRLVHLAYRTLIKMGPKELYEFWKREQKPESPEYYNKNILGFDQEGRYMSSSYYPIFCLIYHDASLQEEEIWQYATDAILLIELLDEKTDFFKSIILDDGTEETEVQNLKYFAASILLLHQMNFPCNAHSLNFIKLPNQHHPTSDDIVKASTTDFGAGAFPLLSMINHSCEPNVVRISLINGVNAVIAIKKISSGDEILDNYGVHFALQDYPERIGHLQSYYHFTCNCIACKNKWPKMDVLQRMENRFMCQNCSSQFSIVGDYAKKSFQDCIIDKSKNWCKKCGTNYDVSTLQKDFTGNCTDEFHTAYDLLLENKPLDCIPTLIKCLTYVESHVLPPCISANFIQETLKQAYNLLAINYYKN